MPTTPHSPSEKAQPTGSTSWTGLATRLTALDRIAVAGILVGVALVAVVASGDLFWLLVAAIAAAIYAWHNANQRPQAQRIWGTSMVSVAMEQIRAQTEEQRTEGARSVIFFLFFISGFAALTYQIVWQRALFAIYGINVESVTVVVSAFMLGLGLGSLLGGYVSTLGIPLVPVFGAAELGTAGDEHEGKRQDSSRMADIAAIMQAIAEPSAGWV